MADNKYIVVVGAGWAGQGVIHGLGELPANARVTVVDAASALPIGATWQYELEGRAQAVAVPFADTLVAPHLKRGTVKELDREGRTVVLEDGTTIPYDYLVLACGAVSDPSKVPGLAEHATDLSAPGFHKPIEAFVEGLADEKRTVVITICKTPYKCPPLPFEVAFLLDDMARRRGKRDLLDIVVTCPVPWPFGGPNAAKAFKAKMQEKGITFRPNTHVEGIEDAGRDGAKALACVATAEEGPCDGIEAHLVLAVYPHRAPDFVPRELLNGKGSVPVDFRTNALEGRGEYCVGDACAAVLPGAGVPIPKAGEFAYKGGVAVGERLARELRGEAAVLPTERFARCVAETGGGEGITVGPDFSAVFADPEAGKPHFVIEPNVATEKTAWIRKYLDTFAPGKAPTFAPGAPREV